MLDTTFDIYTIIKSKKIETCGFTHGYSCKSTAFTVHKREQYGLRCLLPTTISAQETQQHRALETL